MDATDGEGHDSRSATLLRRVGRALARIEREQVCCGEVTRHQFATLHALAEAGGLSTSEVAARLGIDLSTASRNLAVLERAHCIRRQSAPGDARLVHNAVTAKGRACIDALCCDERAAFAAVLERVPRGERPAVVRALSLLAQALEGAAETCCESGAAPRRGVTARTARGRSPPARRTRSSRP